MKILVTAKRVPDPEQKVKFKGNAIDQSAVNWQLNQFDEYAVETALRLTESGSGGARSTGPGGDEVIVVSIGPKEVQQQLRSTLAMGADRAILVEGTDEGLDAELVARTLQKVVEKEKPDLVLMGKQAVDGDANQVGQMLAGKLGWPQATFAASIELAADKARCSSAARSTPASSTRRCRCRRWSRSTCASSRPRRSRTARRRRGVRRGAALRVAQGHHGGEEEADRGHHARRRLGVTAAPRSRRRPSSRRRRRKAGIKVADVAELVKKLHNEAKVL